jgi:hypothetical protein
VLEGLAVRHFSGCSRGDAEIHAPMRENQWFAI